MARLLAAVADTLASGLGGAVAGDVAELAAWYDKKSAKEHMAGKKKGRRTVVALLALSAVASHVAETAAGVAGLRTAAEAATVAAKPTLGTVARDVTDLAALIAFLAAAHAGAAAAAVHVTGAGLGTFTGDVARVAAAVAGLRLRGYSAFSAWRGIVLVGWCWWRGQGDGVLTDMALACNFGRP